MNNLEETIEDSVNDATTPVDAPDTDVATYIDTSPSDDAPADDAPAVSNEVTRGAADTDDPVADEFATKFGLASQSVTGKENRIPYSRVKKIVERAEKEATARITKELEGKFNPQNTELSTKVRDYEERLTKVAQFESILENEPKEFLSMLSKVPAYKEFFDYIGQLANQGATAEQPTSYLDSTTMPQPNETLADGSKVYSLEGLAKRDEWLARQVEEKAIKRMEEKMSARYAPIEQEWQSQQHLAKVVPIIQKQIADARTWPQFTENEADIIAVLKADPNISLEGAWRQVVTPKLQVSRDDMRKSILDEIKRKPVSNTAGPTSAGRPGQVAAGPRSLEDIVREAAQTLK